tara:strand:+ start:784 stop:993 length:210 start_codon:yes stop_codon:yes gene_type:complete
MNSKSCLNPTTPEKRRQMFQKRKLELLVLFRDSLERRLAAVNASIDTLRSQMEKDLTVSNDTSNDTSND